MSGDIRIVRANEARLLVRSSEALLGICQGLLADHVLNEKEVGFLSLWLREHQDIAQVWPGCVVAERVERILAVGKVDDAELAQLKSVLEQLLGGTWEQTGAASGLSSELPIEPDAKVVLAGKTFCFSGKFTFGTRAACKRAALAHGGGTSATITKSVNYLVVGTFITPDWAHTSFGRKIEKAVAYRQNGCDIHIVAERQWQGALDLV